MGHKQASSDLMVRVVLGVLFVGPAVHAAVAMICDPPLWPASWVIDLQAMWEKGRYGLKYTWITTWCFEILPASVLMVLGKALWTLRAAARDPVVDEPASGWELLEQRSRLRNGLVGTPLLAVSAIYLSAIAVAPEQLLPVRFIAVLLLLLSPIMLVAGLVLLLDAVVPPGMHVGSVESRELVRSEQGKVTHRIKSTGKDFNVSAASYEQLVEGTRFHVKTAAVSGRVLALAKPAMADWGWANGR